MKKFNLLFIVTAILMTGCQNDDLFCDINDIVKWDGTTAEAFDTNVEPFVISTPAQLKLLSDIVNGIETIQPSGATDSSSYKLNKCIDLNNLEWTPIGSEESPFKGTFDGGDHTIKGMYINTTEGFQGLFGKIEGGTIKKINMSDCNITAGDVVINNNYIGSIVGYNKNGTVEECVFSGTLTNNGNGTGGIVGKSEGSDARVAYCYNLGVIVANQGCRVGGIVGYNISGSVENCSNNATISGASYYLGGITGQNFNGTVKNCSNTGNLSGTYNIGGIAGVNMTGLISNCYNNGNLNGYTDVMFEESYGAYMGGIAGYNTGTLTNCYNTGSLRTPDKENGNSIGGVVGINDNGVVSYCYYIFGCAKDGLDGVNEYQNGFGSESMESTITDIDGSTNSFTETQGKASHGKTGIKIGSIMHTANAALVDCLNSWQSVNKTANFGWTLTGSKTGYPVFAGE